jgi:hypothetical protein
MNTNNLCLFLDNYEACKDAFIQDVVVYPNRYISEYHVDQDSSLKTHCAYFPAHKKPLRLLIMTSGVHGIEGFVGNAIQRLFLKNLPQYIDLNTTGVLLIHAVNPYGFKYFRRVTANNIDLNRNCFVDSTSFETYKNQAYNQLSSFLNPSEEYSCSKLFIREALSHIVKTSPQFFLQATAGGQYEFEKGIFYGGQSHEPHVLKLKQIVDQYALPYPMVFIIHLHSGVGKQNHLHLIHADSPVIDVEAHHTLFQGMNVNDLVKNKQAYTVTGGMCDFFGKDLTKQGKRFITVTFEYATLGTSKRALFESLRRMIVENQIHYYGCKYSLVQQQELQKFKEMFFPQEQQWQMNAIQKTETIFNKLFYRFRTISH